MVETKEFSELKPGSFLPLLSLRFQFPLQGNGQTGIITAGLEGSEEDQAGQEMAMLAGVPGFTASHIFLIRVFGIN